VFNLNKMNERERIVKNNQDYTLYSWSKQAGLKPITVKTAKGVYLYDYDGKKYIDFSSQLMNANVGHGHPKVIEAIKKQAEQLTFVTCAMATDVRGELGKKLAEITPGDLKKTLFTLSGSDSIENAIKLARLYTGRHKIITHYRSYHGATYGAFSAGGDPRKFQFDNQGVPNIIHVENPYSYRCPWNSKTIEESGIRAAENLERIIQFENPGSVAAILFEGESGTSGCIKYPPFYWKRVKEIADRYGILLIDDEVMSGFGRTGKWFGIDHHGVTPDIMCVAKGLTSGYAPLGGMIVKEGILERFNDIPLPLGLTYSAHSLGCAAALACIEVYEEEKLIENAALMGKYIEEKVQKLAEKHPSIGDFRNTGLLGAIELVKNRETKEPLTPWNASAKDMEPTNRMAAKLRELGLFTFVRWSWIFIAPPLIINKSQIDEGMDIIEKAIDIADEYYHN
jgi:taurine--2-oxoglutarate transaminase